MHIGPGMPTVLYIKESKLKRKKTLYRGHPKDGDACFGDCLRNWVGGWSNEGDSGYCKNGI